MEIKESWLAHGKSSRPYLKNKLKEKQKDWEHWSSGRALAWQNQGLELSLE
jgi:hypothetical protein